MSNPIESGVRRINLPIAPDRRKQDRVITHLPIRIVSVDGIATFHPGVCINLSRGGIGFETPDRLDVGKVVEFEFVRVADEAVRYWIRILFRDGEQYGGYYVNDDGTDIRPSN